MPSEFTNDPDKRDTKLGDAFMLAEDIYYNLPDIKELKYVAGENSPMFRKEWFKKALLSQQGKLEFRVNDSTGQVEMEQPNNTQFYDAAKDTFFWTDPKTGYREDVFDGNGRVNEANYYQFINFFLDATPDRTKIAFVRELVRYTVAQEYGINDGLMTEKELQDNIAEINGLPNAKGLSESAILRTTTTKQKKMQELKARRRAARINLEWAENNSFVTLRPLLIAAKNDTGTRGYDADTKLSTLNYLLRQSGENTAGPIGNPEALGIFRNLSVDTLSGLKTESGLSPHDIYRFIRNLERGNVRWKITRDSNGTTRRELVDLTRERGDAGEFLSLEKALEKNPNTQRVSADELRELKSEYLGKLKFAENAMIDFASNQVNRAYEIFHSLSGGEQLNLGKIVSYDPWKGGVIYDSSAFEELVKDKFLKPMRYAFASNAALNYGSVIRAFVRLKDGQPIFENKLLVDHMFGKDVTDDIKKDVERGKYTAAVLIDGRPDRDDNGKVKMRTLTYAEFVNTSEGRTRLVKNAARARFAAELRLHRKHGLPGERWNAEMVNVMLKSLTTLKQYEEGPDGEIYEVKGKAFFTDEDITWIRKHSGTERYKLWAELYGLEAAELAMGIPGLFAAFTKGLVDI
jgi:hypothetical protein